MDQLESIKNNFSAKIKEKYPNLGYIFYICALAVFIFANFVKNSTLANEIFSQQVIFLMECIPSFFVFIKIVLYDDHDIKDLILFSVFECYLYSSSYICADVSLFYLGFFVYGAKNININDILKTFLIVNVLGIAFAMTLALTDVIRNVKIIRDIYSPVTRYALGSVYPTDFAARGLGILIAYVALRRFKLNLPEFISILMVIFWFYIVTKTRLDLLLSLLLVLVIICYKPLTKLFSKIKVSLINIAMYCYITLIMGLGYLYTVFPENKILMLFNHILSGRLSNNRILILNNPITFSGKYIYQPGGGSGFYIDSVFFRTLYMYGIPFFLLFLIFIAFANHKFMSSPWLLPFELSFILFMLSGGIDQHFWDCSINFVPLIILAKYAKPVSINQKISN